GAVRDPAGRSPWGGAALHRDRTTPDRAADQPAASDRRRAVHPAELCHRRLRHRLPQSRHPPAGAGVRRDAFQLLTTIVLCRRPDRHGDGLSVHDAHLYGHRDPRHLAGPPDHAADGRRHQAHLPHHLGARRRARRPRCLPAGAAIRRPSVRRTVVRPDHLPDLRARRARQFRRRLHRGVRVRRDHFAGRPVLRPRMGLRAGLRLLHRHDVHPARGPFGEALVNSRHAAWGVGLAVLIALPFVYREPYHLHILVLILIWSFAYTAWSIMGRFGLVSLGHGGFMGVGAYVTALLWNHLDVSPWIGIPISMVAAGILALVVAYPCFRFRITGHYFVLVTLALSGIVLQVITATRDYTGGSLGYTPNRARSGTGLMALQFDDKTTWYLIALFVWLTGLLIWRWVDRSMSRYAMEAISE